MDIIKKGYLFDKTLLKDFNFFLVIGAAVMNLLDQLLHSSADVVGAATTGTTAIRDSTRCLSMRLSTQKIFFAVGKGMSPFVHPSFYMYDSTKQNSQL